MKLIEIELTEQQVAELEASTGDETEALLSRIVAESLEARRPLADLKKEVAKIKLRLLEDVLRSCHSLLHAKQPERALALLCPMIGLLDGDTVPVNVLKLLARELESVATESAKAGCKGNM